MSLADDVRGVRERALAAEDAVWEADDADGPDIDAVAEVVRLRDDALWEAITLIAAAVSAEGRAEDA